VGYMFCSCFFFFILTITPQRPILSMYWIDRHQIFFRIDEVCRDKRVNVPFARLRGPVINSVSVPARASLVVAATQ